MKRTIFIVFVLLFITFCALILRPVLTPTEETALNVTGQVSNIWEGPSYDVVIKLSGIDDVYYINRGLEHEFTLNELQELVNEEITIKYPKHWTPLDPTSSTHHISQLIVDGKIIYNEMEG